MVDISRWLICLGWVVMLVSGASQAPAQDDRGTADIVPDTVQVDADKSEGWVRSTTASLGANISESQNVVGKPDGKTSTYTLKLDTSAILYGIQDEWRNTFSISEAESLKRSYCCA